MLKIYNFSYFQDKRIKALFTTKNKSVKRKYNKEKKAKYENYLRKLGLIAYDERFLNCNMNETFSKIYRLNFDKSANSVNVGLNHYILMIPKNPNRKFSWYKPNSEIREYKTINLKYLNQIATIRIFDDTFYYYIEMFLRLPNYSKNIRDWIRKQIDWYILKLLKNGFVIQIRLADKITQNIEKSIKNRSYKRYFLKGFKSIYTYISEEQKEKYLFGKSSLKFKKSEIPLFHNLRLMVNGKLIILSRSINEYLGNDFSSVRELFYIFLEIGLELNGIDIRDITSLELVSYEVAEPLSEFDKTKHRDIPILRNGKGNKRDLAYFGFEDYYDYIDYSDIDDYGNRKPEYEIEYVNRKQKTIPECIRELDFLLDYKPYNKKGIIKIESFDITASTKSKAYCFKNDFLLGYKSDNELKDFNSLVVLALYISLLIMDKKT